MRAAVVGCGWAGTLHAEGLAGAAGVTLAAVCDRDPERARNLAMRYGATPYVTLEGLLAAEQPQLVTVATPTNLHPEHVEACLLAGADVLCEKPLARTPEAALRLAKLAQRMGRRLGVAFNQRLAGGIQFAVRELAAKPSPVLAAHVLQVEQIPVDPTAVPPEFLVTDGVVHAVDLIHYVVGRIRAVSAIVKKRGPLITEVAATLELVGGGVGTLLYACAGPMGSHHPIHRMEVVTVRQRITVDNLWDGAEVFNTDSPAAVHWRPHLFARRDYQATIVEGVRLWAQAMATGQPPPVSAWDGVRAQYTVQTLLDSARAGCRLEVPEIEAKEE